MKTKPTKLPVWKKRAILKEYSERYTVDEISRGWGIPESVVRKMVAGARVRRRETSISSSSESVIAILV